MSIELYDTKSNKVTWSERWQQDWVELPIIKVKLASKLIEKLHVSTKYEKYPSENIVSNEINEKYNDIKEEFQELREMGITHIKDVPISIAEAYEYYLKAKYKWEIRENDEDIEIAQGLLKKAIELDNNLLEAKTQLGFTYYNINNDKAIEIFNSILNYVQKIDNKIEIALALNNIGQVYWVKGDNKPL